MEDCMNINIHLNNTLDENEEKSDVILGYIADFFYNPQSKNNNKGKIEIFINKIQTINQARDFFGFFFLLLENDNELWKLVLALEVGTMLLMGSKGPKIMKQVLSHHYNSIEQYIIKKKIITKEDTKGIEGIIYLSSLI